MLTILLHFYLRIRHLAVQAAHSCRIDEYLSNEKDNRESDGLDDVICIEGKSGRIYKIIVDVGSKPKQNDVSDGQP